MKLRFLTLLLLALLLHPTARAAPQSQGSDLRVQAFLDAQPGRLKTYSDGRQSAAAIIESASFYYGLSPRLHLALLETVSNLLSDPAPPPDALRHPYGLSGPDGFSAQIEWASRELRAGLGPYDQPPIVSFTDGTTITLTLAQAPEGVAVQRFLAIGRTQPAWRALVERFGRVFQQYFNNELPASAPPAPSATSGFLRLPWPAGTPMVHLSYFDHVYPTVDSGPDGNNYVVDYLGQGGVQYNSHDGHDFYFPSQPIGTPILAAAPGVAYARTLRGNGVVIQHDGGYETVYWHLSAFASLFDGRIDTSDGVPVSAGQLIGWSGRSGFVVGTPHLHFEVRHNGREVDPYGWYGPGTDPCAAYAGCERSVWLWHTSLGGQYDFTPPDATATLDRTPPVATLTVNPQSDLRFLARFDDAAVQDVGVGQPFVDGTPVYAEGRFDRGVRLLASGGLSYPISNNLGLEAGTISVWARLPEQYPTSSTGRHYLLAASATPDDDTSIYTGTLALRREQNKDGVAQWNFWTTSQGGERNDLTSADTLGAGWHHIAATWDAAQGTKTLYLDGVAVASAHDVTLPTDVGPLLQLGRFAPGSTICGCTLDELAVFDRVLAPDTIATLAHADAPLAAGVTTVRGKGRGDVPITLDTNALDDSNGPIIVKLAVDDVWSDPLPYDDSFTWRLPRVEGNHTLQARFIDRAGNSTTVTKTVQLDLPPAGSARVVSDDGIVASLVLSATDNLPRVEMQISASRTFAGASWRPIAPEATWAWGPTRRRVLYIRFRDAGGLISDPITVGAAGWRVWLPVVIR